MLFGGVCISQSFKLDKATSQGWAGGVAGHHGVNYYIELETASRKIAPDTVCVNGNVYPINFSPTNGSYVRTIDSITHQIKYVFSISESHNDFRNLRHPNQQNDTAARTHKAIRTFSGAAMISYTLKHKQHFFIVNSFTRLPQLNYP